MVPSPFFQFNQKIKRKMRLSSPLEPVTTPCISKPSPKLSFPCNSSLATLPSRSITKSLSMDNVQASNYIELDSGSASTSASSSSSWTLPTRPGSIGASWMDIQGMKNWEGLLDPLDNNLRGEIIRYGHFVEAAYRSCEFEPSSPSYSKCRFSKRKLLVQSGFSETGYRITENLHATSGIQLPGWIEKAPSWISMRSSWIGYVAVCQDKRVISKLGRRDVVIALRGTVTCLEWLENLRATLTPLSNDNAASEVGANDYSSCPMVESGFLSLYTSRVGTSPSLQDLVRQESGRILETYGDEPLSFTITGHSLGAALATLAAYDIKETFKCEPLVTVISFGGPRVGNQSFRCHLEEQGTKVLRIVNSDDLITKMPGFVIDNNEDNLTKHNNESAPAGQMVKLLSWIQKIVEDSQWVYADVGCELRLSSRDSPYVNGFDFASCHELKTYLHLVNGFVSSNCPIRATARKLINKSLVP
ncbi:phospholipase A(1) DAD1, chloroplastic-like [Coffea arabica]|uniref:Phospholipase A(1) DAD1, chloroplastic-like n=2 Tax=Coffea TaxID=13442 RepID=A0A6P6W489_COFAR